MAAALVAESEVLVQISSHAVVPSIVRLNFVVDPLLTWLVLLTYHCLNTSSLALLYSGEFVV